VPWRRVRASRGRHGMAVPRVWLNSLLYNGDAGMARVNAVTDISSMVATKPPGRCPAPCAVSLSEHLPRTITRAERLTLGERRRKPSQPPPLPLASTAPAFLNHRHDPRTVTVVSQVLEKRAGQSCPQPAFFSKTAGPRLEKPVPKIKVPGLPPHQFPSALIALLQNAPVSNSARQSLPLWNRPA